MTSVFSVLLTAAFSLKGDMIYEKLQKSTLWFEGQTLNSCGKEVISLLSKAEEEGLTPPLDVLNKIQEGPTLDRNITQAFMAYVSAMSGERFNPRKISKIFYIDAPAVDEEAFVTEEYQRGCRFYEALAPQHPQYKKLKTALRILRQDPTPWVTITPGPTLSKGDKGSRVLELKTRLKEEGLLSEWTSSDFDKDTETAVKEFQKKSGFEEDGRVGKKTLEILNVPKDERMIQISMNMERLRWLPKKIEGKQIIVNIPGFSLMAFKDGEVALEMPIIVGRIYRKTPLFSAPMTGIIFNPVWHVPSRIAKLDKLPLLKKNPEALKAKGYKLYGLESGAPIDLDTVDWHNTKGFPYRLIQTSGDHNALGRIRFTIQNNFDVYLHGTPEQNLFKKNQRAFSSGCIRVEDPIKLATFVLGDLPEWDEKRIQETIDKGSTKTLFLESPLLVHMTYLTAWVDETGKTLYYSDLYEQDKAFRKIFGRKYQ